VHCFTATGACALWKFILMLFIAVIGIVMGADMGPPGLAASSAHDSKHPHITCRMVRAYVARVGVEKAKATARRHGMTPGEEQQARHCLAHSA